MNEIIENKNNKNYLATSILIFMAQFFVLVFSSYRAASDHWDVNLYLLVFLGLPIFAVLGASGMFFSARGCLERGVFRILFMCCMVSSLFFGTIIGPIWLSVKLSPIFYSPFKKQALLEEKMKKDNTRKRYDELSEIFKKPQKVIAVSNGEILLENKIALSIGCADLTKCDLYIKNNVLNQEVEIYMIDFDKFKEKYESSYPKPSSFSANERNASFAPFSAYVMFRGEFLNLQFNKKQAREIITKYPELSKRTLIGVYEYFVDSGGVGYGKSDVFFMYKGVTEADNVFTHVTYSEDQGKYYEEGIVYGGDWKEIVDSGLNKYSLQHVGLGIGNIEFTIEANGIRLVKMEERSKFLKSYFDMGTFFRKVE